MAFLERIKIVDEGGNVVTPLTEDQLAQSELISAIESLRMSINSLNRSVGQTLPDTAGRLRVNVEAGNIGSVNSLLNIQQIGGLFATDQLPSLLRIGADSLRRNINVS
jgi:hypothetical protein